MIFAQCVISMHAPWGYWRKVHGRRWIHRAC